MNEHIAECVNLLGRFCGKRDVPDLSAKELKLKYHICKADVMVLFGGSILCGGDLLAEAMKNKIADQYIIVGGAGHTTEALRFYVHDLFPAIKTADLPEAGIFAAYLNYKYGLKPDFLECRSTNCGNNITYLLDLLKSNDILFDSMILMQDATMQHRMEAGMRKYVPEDVQIINYAAYSASVIMKNHQLAFKEEIEGMWDMEQYITLLMGEIERLNDDQNGYGPKGKNFIVHVEIPEKVKQAFAVLKEEYGGKVRSANPLYASSSEADLL